LFLVNRMYGQRSKKENYANGSMRSIYISVLLFDDPKEITSFNIELLKCLKAANIGD